MFTAENLERDRAYARGVEKRSPLYRRRNKPVNSKQVNKLQGREWLAPTGAAVDCKLKQTGMPCRICNGASTRKCRRAIKDRKAAHQQQFGSTPPLWIVVVQIGKAPHGLGPSKEGVQPRVAREPNL